jgi:hypothetical protein
MGGNYCKGGKYAESFEPFDTSQIMRDDKFLLMQQCMKDARQLVRMTQHFGTNAGPYLSGWETYEKQVTSLAKTLFHARVKSPVNIEDIKALIMGTESVIETKEELLFLSKEVTDTLKLLSETQKKFDEVSEAVEKEKTLHVKLRSENFLLTTVGSSDYYKLQTMGYLDVKGINGAIYRIHADGKIDKFWLKQKGLLTKHTEQESAWHGKIVSCDNMNDAIATVIIHIKNDSNKFDIDKACGNITIQS